MTRKYSGVAVVCLMGVLSCGRAGAGAAAGGPAEAAVAVRRPVPHDTFTIASAVLGEARRINVYTPPRYGDSQYPVLYVLDGGVREAFSHVAATVDAAIRSGEMRAMIVVGIENTDRPRDMTGPTGVEEDRRMAPRVGGSAEFRRFIRDELMPRVGGRYHVTREAAVIGESLAGLFVVETFMVWPTLFDTYIALGPSLGWNGGELARTADARIKAGNSNRRNSQTVVYLSSAGEDSIALAAARLAEALRANASDELRWQYRPRPELTHATLYRAEAPRLLRDLFPPVYSIFSLTSDKRLETTAGDTAMLTPLEHGTAVMRETVGSFAVMREEYRAEQWSHHAVNRWTKIHLSFHAPDAEVNVTLTDNGAGLSSSARSLDCFVSVRYLQYGYDGDERHLFGAMLTALRTLVSQCGRIMDDPARAQRLLEAAEADFPEAMRLMKARVAEEFGARMERCTPPGPPDPRSMPSFSPHDPDPCGPF